MKLKAFTLSEMLVTLMITTIVVGMAFAVLHLVQRQMHGIDGNYERNTAFNILRQGLWIDFNQCDGAWYDQKANQLIFANGLKETVYRLHDGFIAKEKDTFRIEVASQHFFFKGLQQPSGEIDALRFALSKKNGSKALFVYKKNAATSYIND
ncbi:MAG: prepilin-type N-terminal cleavage/methylation domain-containing protein [Bacteroidota bacterium]